MNEFWVLLATAWRHWRSALVVVQPETVVRWHRDWLRRRWARRSGRNPGRPALDLHVRELIAEMASANPLWGARASTANSGKSGLRFPNGRLASAAAYYHRSRTHLSLAKDAPDRRPSSSGPGTIVVVRVIELVRPPVEVRGEPLDRLDVVLDVVFA